MATHSSILAWRIPWTEEPGELLSIGSHRVGHDWGDLVCMHALEKEMATHSSILAWRSPGTEDPGGLPSMGLQSRTGLRCLAAAAVNERDGEKGYKRWGKEKEEGERKRQKKLNLAKGWVALFCVSSLRQYLRRILMSANENKKKNFFFFESKSLFLGTTMPAKAHLLWSHSYCTKNYMKYFRTLEILLFSFSLFLAIPHGMWDLSSPTRDWTHAPSLEA